MPIDARATPFKAFFDAGFELQETFYGNELPHIVLWLKELDGSAYNLTGYQSVSLIVRHDNWDERIINNAALTIDDATNGQVSYIVPSADANRFPVGELRVKVRVSHTAGGLGYNINDPVIRVLPKV